MPQRPKVSLVYERHGGLVLLRSLGVGTQRSSLSDPWGQGQYLSTSQSRTVKRDYSVQCINWPRARHTVGTTC